MKASLALCYFYSLPVSISDYLFSVEFLERLDNELNNYYGKVVMLGHVLFLLLLEFYHMLLLISICFNTMPILEYISIKS